MKKALFFLLIFFSFNAISQSEDLTEVIEFACFSKGKATQSVTKFAKLIKSKKYSEIKELLISKNNAEKYLAIICSENLQTLKFIRLTNKEKEIINEAYKSKNKVGYCSGCLFWEELKYPLDEILKADHNIRVSTNDWFYDQLED